MHFCSNCGNMYYIRLSGDEQNDLTYYCRNCGQEDKTIQVNNVCVTDSKMNNETTFSHAINRYTRLDPTLPHITTIKCPNAICDSNEDETKRDVIYLRYDDSGMKYIYICSVCDSIWKTDEQR